MQNYKSVFWAKPELLIPWLADGLLYKKIDSETMRQIVTQENLYACVMAENVHLKGDENAK